MTLGEKLRQARLEAGLSQRQLCGEAITRNMLSQIENGSARPSVATLQYLAQRLGKPVGYFLQEEATLSPNLPVMTAARRAYKHRDYAGVLRELELYGGPDPVFDPEKQYLQALSALALAESVLDTDPARAEKLLELVSHGSIYYTEAMEQSRRRLLHRAWAILEEQARRAQDYQQAYAYACKRRG